MSASCLESTPDSGSGATAESSVDYATGSSNDSAPKFASVSAPTASLKLSLAFLKIDNIPITGIRYRLYKDLHQSIRVMI